MSSNTVLSRLRKAPWHRALMSLLATSGIIAFGYLLHARLRYNRTPSVPTGWYWITPASTATVGQLVAFCPPPTALLQEALRRGYITGGDCAGNLSAMIKVVAAGPGDLVRFSAAGVTINGRRWPKSQPLKRDPIGRPLATPPSMYSEVPAGFFVALSQDLPSGFDSRYFGLVPSTQVQGTATRLSF